MVKNVIGWWPPPPPSPEKKKEDAPETKYRWRYEVVPGHAPRPPSYRRLEYPPDRPPILEHAIRQRWRELLKTKDENEPDVERRYSTSHRWTAMEDEPKKDRPPKFDTPFGPIIIDPPEEPKKEEKRPIHIHLGPPPKKEDPPPTQPRFIWNGGPGPHPIPFPVLHDFPPQRDEPPTYIYGYPPPPPKEEKKKEPDSGLTACQWDLAGKVLGAILALIIIWTMLDAAGKIVSTMMTPFKMAFMNTQYAAPNPYQGHYQQPYPQPPYQQHAHQHAHQYQRQ